jgi:cytochrome c556
MRQKPADFEGWLRDGKAAARELEQAFRHTKLAKKLAKKLDVQAVAMTFAKAGGLCTACHTKYRD